MCITRALLGRALDRLQSALHPLPHPLLTPSRAIHPFSDVGSPVDGAGDGAPGGELDEDEAFARGLAEAEARDWNERMLALAGVPPGGDLPPDEEEELEEDGVDVDAMSYEELLALGDAAGHVSRGLAAALIAALPRSAYAGAGQSGEQCAVCREEFQTGEEVATLPCRHFFHAQCAEPWLKLQKVCPCCKAELTPGKLRQA